MSAADDAVGAKVGEDVRKALTRADREEAKVLFGLGFTGIFVLGGFELLLDGLKVVGGLGLAAAASCWACVRMFSIFASSSVPYFCASVSASPGMSV